MTFSRSQLHCVDSACRCSTVSRALLEPHPICGIFRKSSPQNSGVTCFLLLPLLTQHVPTNLGCLDNTPPHKKSMVLGTQTAKYPNGSHRQTPRGHLEVPTAKNLNDPTTHLQAATQHPKTCSPTCMHFLCSRRHRCCSCKCC